MATVATAGTVTTDTAPDAPRPLATHDGRDHGQGRWPGLMPKILGAGADPAIAVDALTPGKETGRGA